MRARQASADQLDHLIDREAMGEHDRLGASVAGHGEQFEGASAVGLGAHGDGGEGEAWSQWRLVDRIADSQDTTTRPSEGGPFVRYLALRASRSGIGASEEERSILSMPRMVPDERALERVGNRRGFGGCGRATPQGETVRLKTIVRTYSLAGASDPAF